MPIPQTEVFVFKDGAEVARYVMAPGEYTLGRNPDCDLVVEADLVSRRHAKITINSDHALIEDLNSSNGTLVNGKPVVGNTRLWPNQKIQVGSATIELRRLKVESTPDMTVTPTGEVMRRVLPEAFLREKKYDIGGVVAQGGMGAILNAKEATTERTVAMKVMLNTNSPDDLLRFLNEAKVTAQLEHPNIVPVHELNVDENDQVFYTMKMVKGITLKKVLELIAEGVAATVKKYPLAALLTVFQKVCDALAFAHSKRVIHRDLKPENIMIGDYGEVLLMDWGLAKVLDPARAMPSVAPGQDLRSVVHIAPAGGQIGSATLAGTVMGTPHFMSPEQARGEVETLDARSDIYALGAILYQILSLRVPVDGTDAWEIVGKVARGEIEPLECGGKRSATPLWQERSDAEGKARPHAPPSPGAPRPSKSAVAATLCQRTPKREIPDSLAAVVRKAMSLDREARYRSVPELQQEIDAYQNGFATSAEKAGTWKQFTLLVKRHKALFSSAAAAVVIIAAVVGIAFKRVAGERNVAFSERNRATDALASLRKTAPVFAAQAQALLEQEQLEKAIENLDIAVSLEPQNPDYLLHRANLLQAVQRLTEAAESYRSVLGIRKDAVAQRNVDLCEKLLRENPGSSALNRAGQIELMDALLAQKRTLEAVPLGKLLQRDSATAEANIKARLKNLASIPGFNWNRLVRLPNGTFSLSIARPLSISVIPDLSGLPITQFNCLETEISDLTPLKSLRLTSLTIGGTRVTDISVLAGMPLEYLQAVACKIGDISPLRGMPLKELVISSTLVSDLRPLAGMPLEQLDLARTPCKDLSPLHGLRLRRLTISDIPAQDFSPLNGMPLEELEAWNTRTPDISVVRTLPLRALGIAKANLIRDLRPLAECKTLEILSIPKSPGDISFLRSLPNLKVLDEDQSLHDIKKPAAQFWEEYDARKAKPLR